MAVPPPLSALPDACVCPNAPLATIGPGRAPGKGSAEEPGLELVATFVPLLAGERVAHVVLPHTLDLQEARGGALVAQAELGRDAPALGVAGHDRRLQAVKAELLEPVAHHDRHRVGRVAAARVPLVDPVADEARLERAPQHAAEAHLADERAVEEKGPEAVGAVELALAVPCATPGAERLAVDDRIARAGLRQRLPPLEPVATARADLTPRVVVANLERSEHHPRAHQGRLATSSHRA